MLLLMGLFCVQHTYLNRQKFHAPSLINPVMRFLWMFLSLTKEYACSELRSCVKVEVDVLGCQSLVVLMASVDVKQH